MRTKPPLRVEAYCVSNSKEGKCIAKFPVSNNFILDASVDAGNTSIAQEDCEIARLAVEISLQSPTGLADAPAEIVNAYMTKLINTGRLHLQSLDSAPLTRGKMLPGKLSWVLLGHAVKPRLAAIEKDERHSCLPMGDGWYINEEKGCTGRIDFPLPLTILKAFTEGLEFPQIWQSPFDHMVVALGLDCVIDTADAIPNIERRIEKPSVSIDLVWLTQMQKSFKKAVRVIEVMLHFSKKNGEYLHDGTGSYFYNIHDRSAHHSIVERLELLGLQQTNSTNLYGQKQDALYFTFENNIHLAEFVRLHAPQLKMDGWQLRENFSKPLKPVQINDIKISLTKDKAWWYSLYLDIEVEGERVSLLPVLLEVIQLLPPGEEITEEAISDLNQNGLFHALLPGGQLISISFERISNILITLGEMIQNQCRSKRLQISAFEIDDILKIVPEELEQSHEVEGLLDLERRLTRIKQTGDIEPPKMFNAQLRPYQMQGLRWLQCLAEGHFGGILADDMGLGKTVQVLAHITLEKEKNRMSGKPFLVVCPTSVLPNWQAEIRKFAPHLNVFEHYGLDRNQRISNMAHADVVLTTYPLLARDNSLQDIDWHGIALDESQAIKNSTSQIAQAACRLNATHRFCITGTPIENHLGELWSQFQFLLPGYLGTQAEFRSIVRDPIERDAEYIIKRGLSRRIRPFILRRTKDEVAQDLPEKVKMIKVVELAGAQRDLYETVRLSCSAELRTQMLQQGFGRSRISILSTLQKLRQVCCDPRLLERNSIMKEGKSAKLELLMEMLHDVIEEGRKVLVFSQFTSMLDLIAHELEGAEIPFVQLRGDTKDRVTPVREFQEGQTQVFLLSLKAGGSGLNLTAADVVIHYDPWWNPAAEEQATDRAHRIGQKNKVFVYKLIASGTIEERMIAMQEQKRSLARGVLDEQKSNAPLFTFSEEEMWDLVAPLAEISKPAVSFA